VNGEIFRFCPSASFWFIYVTEGPRHHAVVFNSSCRQEGYVCLSVDEDRLRQFADNRVGARYLHGYARFFWWQEIAQVRAYRKSGREFTGECELLGNEIILE